MAESDQNPNPLKKGDLIIVKVAPLYEKTYFYEITSAGEKLIRANLYNSPKVRKSWSTEEFEALMKHGIVRPAEEHEKPEHGSGSELT